MPWLDLVSRSDWCSLWYICNGPTGCTSSFDPAKPTVLMLHPVLLDTTWLRAQWDDTRLGEAYNLVGMDSRCHGRTKSTPSGKHDIWVEAADVAFFCHRLRLPAVHIFAAEGVATYCALRFAALFPEMVLSLTLCQVPPPEQISWARKMHEHLVDAWCATSDLTTLEDLGMSLTELFVGDVQNTDPDLMDELNAFFQRYLPPITRSRIQEFLNVIYRRTVIEKAVLDAIVQPVLIIQGEWSQINPLKAAKNLVRDLVNVQGGARLYTVHGGKGYINIVPACATIVNDTFVEFLSSLPHHRSDIVPAYQPVEQRMVAALATLATLTGNPEIAHRDPRCPLSFSLLSAEDAAADLAAIERRAVGQANAFSPLGPDGWPVRAYSQRGSEPDPLVELLHGGKLRTQPSALGVIPIGPAVSRLGTRRKSDQDLATKLARGGPDAKQQQQQQQLLHLRSADGGGRVARARRGTGGHDPPSGADKHGKGTVKKLAVSAAASMRFQ